MSGAGISQGANEQLNGGAQQGFPCEHCDRVFSTKSGKGIHQRRTHAKKYHAQAEAQSATLSRRYWAEEEKNRVSTKM